MGRQNLVRQIAQRKPALIHAHFATDACTALPLVKDLRIPIVVTLHGYDVTTPNQAFEKTFFGRAYLTRRAKLWEVATKFLCISNYIRSRALEKGFPEEKLWVHYIGVDSNKFRPETSPQPEQIILFVGRLVPEKGCGHLIRSMVMVQKQIPAAKLVIVGDGPERIRLQEEASRSLKNFQFLGSQPADAVKHWISCCRVLAVPSITEGLGMVFCEAQDMGVPVASFAIGGIPEVVVHGESGLLATTGDDEQLAQHLVRLLRDPDLCTRMGRAGRSRVERMFNLRTQTQLLEEKYGEVIAKRSSADFISRI